MLLPVDFPYWAFALLIVVNGLGVGLFSAPNAAAIMSSVPGTPERGAASGDSGDLPERRDRDLHRRVTTE